MPAIPTPTRLLSASKLETRTPLVPSRSSSSSPKRERRAAPAFQPIQKTQPVQNRVRVLLVHIPKLSIRGQARLAAEVGVSRSTISRLVSGRINPSYRLARGITDALERLLGKPLDMREVFSTDGTYLTASGCALCRCKGCLPDEAWTDDGTLKPEWQSACPGDWSLARPADPTPNSTGSTHNSTGPSGNYVGEGKEVK